MRRVYRAHVRPVYRFFSYSVGRATAEDLTSQTFERVVASWDRFDPARASERTWILAIARNQLVDHYRRESVRRSVSLDEQPALVDALVRDGDAMGAVLSTAAFASWLRLVGARERQILALRFAGDQSPADIAEVMDLSVANVHQIISRALRRLREIAEESEPSRRP